MNIQFAIKDDVVYVLEVNPRASRTVPFLSKATGVPLAKAAARVMLGRTLADIGLTGRRCPCSGVFVKTPVFPFVRFQGVDILLGPEMKSTGEAMGCGDVVRRRVRQGAGGRRADAARLRDRVHLRERPRQADRAAGRARPRRRSASR